MNVHVYVRGYSNDNGYHPYPLSISQDEGTYSSWHMRGDVNAWGEAILHYSNAWEEPQGFSGGKLPEKEAIAWMIEQAIEILEYARPVYSEEVVFKLRRMVAQ